MRLLDRIIDWWLRRCSHDGSHVAADILQGGFDSTRVAYCRRCGAYRVHFVKLGTYSDWDRPRPLWFPRRG